jgi:hypothetical protein
MTEAHLTSPFLPVVGEDGRIPGIAQFGMFTLVPGELMCGNGGFLPGRESCQLRTP